jgi:steroid delta-isomerase-like uncharacterized protein
MNDPGATVMQFYKAFEAADFDTAMALFSPDCINSNPSGPQNVAEHRGYAETFKAAIPDAHMEIERIVVEGDEVAAIGKFKGTHSGPLRGPQGEIPPSGNTLDLPFADFFTVTDGMITDHRTYFDQIAMFTALGAMPG